MAFLPPFTTPQAVADPAPVKTFLTPPPRREIATDTTIGAPAPDGKYVWLGLSMLVENVPDTLKHIDNWVMWKAERNLKGKIDKVPYTVLGVKASCSDSRTWTDFKTAVAAYLEEDSDFDGAGIEIVPQIEIVPLDFDHVRDAHSGVIDADVLMAIKRLNTYAEISPSGTGIRVIGFGTLSHAVTAPKLQAWNHGRYVTVTGHRLPGVPEDLQPYDPKVLAEVIAQFASEIAPSARPLLGASLPLDSTQCLEIRQALGYLDPDASYDQWLSIGMALHSTAAPNAYGLWNEWSLTGPKYDPKVCRSKWASFTHNGQGLQLASLFQAAMQAGWVNSATREARAFATVTGMTIEEANRKTPDLEVRAVREVEIQRFPVSGLDEIAAWMEQMAAVSYPVVTQQAVLALLATAAGRRYITPMGDPVSLYLGTSGQSIGDLRYTHSALKGALEAAGLRKMIRGTRFTSPQTIYRTLMKSPAALYLSDDYGGVSALARRQPSGAQEHALSVLAQVYTGSDIHLDDPADAGFKPGSVGEEQPVIRAPALSMFALVGSDHLATLMRASEVGRGALGQLLLAIAEEDQVMQRDPTPQPAPSWLASRLCELRGVPSLGPVRQTDLATINNNNAENVPYQTLVTFHGETAPVYAALDAISADRRARPLLRDARTHIRRIAALLAIWQDPIAPVVDECLLAWSGEYVRSRLAAMLEKFALLHSSDGKEGVYDKVLKHVLEAKTDGLARGALASLCWHYRVLSAKSRNDLIDQMLDDGALFEVSIKIGGRGQQKKRLVAEKYVKN